jgi:hypothetical protein
MTRSATKKNEELRRRNELAALTLKQLKDEQPESFRQLVNFARDPTYPLNATYSNRFATMGYLEKSQLRGNKPKFAGGWGEFILSCVKGETMEVVNPNTQ